MTSTAWRGRGAVLAWLLLCTACGGTESGVSGFDIGLDLWPGFDVPDAAADLARSDADVVDKDPSADPGADADQAGLDAAPDVATDVAPDVDVHDLAPDAPDTICDPLAGTGSCPCGSEDECPPDWACRDVQLPGGADPVFLCVPLFASLCAPCASAADCLEPWGVDAACLDFGATQGHFCGGVCGADDACPAGTHCADATTIGAEAVRQCLPDDGVCACSAHAIELGLSTPCTVTTAWGTCFGRRTCTEAGLTACDAPTPADEVCGDGVDNDCDGVTDDDTTPTATTCGIGPCAATGTLTCVDGTPSDSCAPGTPAADDATCDAIDDDCDGTADDEFAAGPSTCGSGACASSGPRTCADGHEVDTCLPLPPAADDATCDATDDDCDGLTDEDVAAVPLTCGVGACAASGQRACVAGDLVDQCEPGQPEPDDATCDAIDDDCDGQTDEDVAPTITTCGAGACAAEGLTTCVDGSILDSCAPGQPAADDATCDAIDDDCDGATDDDYLSRPVECGVGACLAHGTTACVAGVEDDSCAPGDGSGTDGVCNGLDDDCDGVADDDYLPIATTCGLGACAAAGLKTCVGGVEADSCQAGVPALADATCNAQDDDCDGSPDDDYLPVATTCGVGACASTGAKACLDGVETDSCQAGVPALDDATCDAIDDDCDGSPDDDYAGRGVTCGVGACQAAGTTVCQGGVEHDSCTPLGGAGLDTICNGVDDDCDGATDEDYAASPTTCGVGACQAAGQRRCVGGLETDSCSPGAPAPADPTCDGRDDDCDGSADDDYVAPVTTCGVGACQRSGLLGCQGGSPLDSCTPGQPGTSDASCNGVDDDCDGATDEGYVPHGVACGVGACQATGTSTCEGGVERDSCTPGSGTASDVVCNGLDDDCDGLTDEDFVAAPTTCGVGPCAAAGQKTCVDGGVVDSCTPGTPAATDDDCDGVDDDCSGVADDDYIPAATTCGAGACAATGQRTCAAGHESDSCAPGAPHPEVCNGVDDDCNGKTDASDGAALLTNDQPFCEKQAGVCLGTKKTVAFCVNGAWKPCNDAIYAYWVPAYQAVEGPTCDGQDNDCDAAIDEAYVPTATACGTGACAAVGQTACVAGQEVDSCTPGTPAPTDADCDGVDDDCNGTPDDDYVSVGTTCGTGACARTGQRTCVGGHEADSCKPGTPAVGDPICDGIDADCDGATDEDFGVQIEFCGQGACRATGTRTCVGGTTVVTCTPGVPAASDATCDGVDDDCNGATDEDYIASPTTCGTGACARTGQKTCQGGAVVDSCVPGPVQPEACNGLDDDCDGAIDQGEGNALCTTYFHDGDNDTFGDPDLSRCLCQADGPAKYTTTDQQDCCDKDANARPTQGAYSPTATACGGFDFDCSGAEEKAPGGAGHCTCSGFLCSSCSGATGWDGPSPACGVEGTWIQDCKWVAFQGCVATRVTVKQACR